MLVESDFKVLNAAAALCGSFTIACEEMYIDVNVGGNALGSEVVFFFQTSFKEVSNPPS